MAIWFPEISRFPGARYRAIAEAIKEAIETGVLKPDDRLLPHRQMAHRLKVTIGTVARGYNLAAEWGLVSGEVGRGTVVKPRIEKDQPLSLTRTSDIIDMGLALPVEPTDTDLARAAYEQTMTDIGAGWRASGLSGYPPEFGLPHHRAAGATWIARRGLTVSPEEVVVTASAQEAFQLLLAVYARPGDSVLLEACTYLGLKNLCTFMQLNAVPVSIDDEGMQPEALDDACSRVRAKVVVLCPTLQNPTSATMGLDRRRQIVEVARKHDLLIVEDDAFAELAQSSFPALAELASERTFYVTSLSKCVCPGIRVGYLKALPTSLRNLEAAKHCLSIAGNTMTPEIAARWIANGIAERLVTWQREELMARQRIAADLLSGWDFRAHPTGPILWLSLPESWRASDFVFALRDRQVTVIEAERFTVGRAAAPHAIRVSVSSPPTREDLTRGLEIIRGLLDQKPRPAFRTYTPYV